MLQESSETDCSSQTITQVKFRTALVEIDRWNIWATFSDGVRNQFWLPGRPKDYAEIAETYGYTDKDRYAFEHELAHHFIADNLGMKWSWSVHDGASFENRPTPAQWANHIAWEENIVNAFQHYCIDGTRDRWGTLHCVFPENKLNNKRSEFRELTRKVLDKKRSVFYNHETGHVGYIGKKPK